MLYVNEKNFEQEVLKSDKPVVVDFYADWCGPCRMLAPVLEQLDAAVAGKAVVAKLNVDENQHLAAKYNVMSIPTIIFFKDGKAVGHQVGLQSLQSLQRAVESLL
ncbi:MAG: thioredoxin [Clostridiaceae bacterium]|nr:thioredoxin [Clostridiaceae bacterium]